MPSAVKSGLNNSVVSIWQPAEVNAGTLRVTAGIAINNEGGSDIEITSLVYSAWFLDPTDYARVNSAYLVVQRGVDLREDTVWQTVEKFSELLLYYVPQKLSDVLLFPRPLVLPVGYRYAI